MKHEQWEQAGSAILSRGEAWVCIMAEPHHSQPRPIDITSPDWDEAMKRARTLVAAPELLAALGKLADEAERVLLVEQDYERDLPHLRLAFVKAQAAIAKAEGEA